MRPVTALTVYLLFLGCSPSPNREGRSEEEAVPGALDNVSRETTRPAGSLHADPSLDEFMAALAQGDYHAIVNRGKGILVPGKVVGDHVSRFAKYPSEPLANGLIRYTLNQFHGKASAGGVTLTLEAVSGTVVKFDHFEATLE